MKRWLPKRLPFQDIGGTLLDAVDKAVDQRWDAARERARSVPGAALDDRVDEVVDDVVRELTAIGAASGGAAALPGAGTATAVLTTAADLGWFAVRVSDLVLTVGVLHGHTEATREERRSWVLSVLAFGDEAATGFFGAVRQLGPGLRRKAAGGGLSSSALLAVNTRIATSVVKRWGARRGAAAVGTLLPFGVGAAIGAVTNRVGARAVGRQAHVFFTELAAGDPVGALSEGGGSTTG